jgi:hypothetical protein
MVRPMRGVEFCKMLYTGHAAGRPGSALLLRRWMGEWLLGGSRCMAAGVRQNEAMSLEWEYSPGQGAVGRGADDGTGGQGWDGRHHPHHQMPLVWCVGGDVNECMMTPP